MQAVIGLLGAVIGGLLVVVGDVLARRHQERRDALKLAWDNAGEILATQRLIREYSQRARLAGRDSLTDEELADISAADRVQDTRFYMLPIPETLRSALRSSSETSRKLIASIGAPEATWMEASREQKQSIYDFEAEMRLLLGARKRDRRVVP